MHDLDIVKDGQVVGAVEVTSVADAQSTALWKVGNPDKGWTVPGIAGGWIVQMGPDCPRPLLRRQLPALLAELEKKGVTELPRARHGRGPIRSGFPVADRLKLRTARQSPTDNRAASTC